MKRKKIFIVGIVGVPANYGGFETLVEQLLMQWKGRTDIDVTVFCSDRTNAVRRTHFNGARLIYIPLPANGIGSIAYDALCMLIGCIKRADSMLVLGVSGGLALPLVRLLSRCKVIVNLDGYEAGRAKWGSIASIFLKLSTWAAKISAHQLIIDNAALVKKFKIRSKKNTAIITYGGDHAIDPGSQPVSLQTKQTIENLNQYGLAIARIVPENNVHLILQVVAQLGVPFVFIGNWTGSAYGLKLKERYAGFDQIKLIDELYAPADVFALRAGASYYIHGHSAGGTNPSLVEMMFFPIPIFAYDCPYNRVTTKEQGYYFCDEAGLEHLISRIRSGDLSSNQKSLLQVAKKNYVWSEIAHQYLRLVS